MSFLEAFDLAFLENELLLARLVQEQFHAPVIVLRMGWYEESRFQSYAQDLETAMNECSY